MAVAAMNPAMPDLSIAAISQVQTAVSQLLIATEPAFVQVGRGLLATFVIINLALYGRAWMFGEGGGAMMDQLTRFLLQTAIATLALTYYTSPLPGMSSSFSTLVPDSTAYLASILESRSFTQAWQTMDLLWAKFSVFDVGSVASYITYGMLYVLVAGAKAASLAIIAFGFIATGVTALVGPVFIPWLLFDSFSWLFWGWLRSTIQFAFLPVCTLAYLYVGQALIGHLANGLPDTIARDQMAAYGVQVIAVLISFIAGLVSVPILNASIFSGHSHGGDHGSAALRVVRVGK